MIKFDLNHIVSSVEIDRERSFLEKRLIPARVLRSIAECAALFAGVKAPLILVPWGYQSFLKTEYSAPNDFFVVLCTFVIFMATTLGLLKFIHFVANRCFFKAYRNLQELDHSEVSEALSLAESQPVLERYRLDVARTRAFVRGDLDLMRHVNLREVNAQFERRRAERMENDKQQLTKTI